MSSNLLRTSTLLKAHFKNGLGFILIIFFQLLSQQASSQGKYVWAEKLKTPTGHVNNLAALPNGGVHFDGSFTGSIEIDKTTINATSKAPYIKNFIARTDSADSVVWVAKQGCSENTNLSYYDTKVDEASASYTVGWGKRSAYLYDVKGTLKEQIGLSSSYTNGFLFKYDSNGNPIWSAKMQSSRTNTSFGAIGLDDSAHVHVLGGFNSSGSVSLTGVSGSLSGQGGSDILLARYDSSGVLKWHRVLGSKQNDNYDFMVVDQHGNSYVQIGFGQSTKIDTFNFNAASYVLKFNRFGKLVSSHSSILDGDYPPILSRDGNFYVGTEYRGNGNIPGIKLPYAANRSPVLLKYDSLFSLKWAKGYPGTIAANGDSYLGLVNYSEESGKVYFSGVARDTLDFGVGKAHPGSKMHVVVNDKSGNVEYVDTVITDNPIIHTVIGKHDYLYCYFRLEGRGSLGKGYLNLGQFKFVTTSNYFREPVVTKYEFPCSGKSYRLQSPAFACSGDSINLRVNGGHVVSWYADTTRIDSGSSSTRVLFNNQTSVKAIIYDTVANCVVSKFMETKPFPSATVKFDTIPISCANADSFGLKVTNSFTGVLDSFYGNGVVGKYFYPTQASVGSNLVYHHFKDSNSCITTTSANMVVLGLPSINGGVDTTVCDGDSAKLTANGANTYEWNWLSNSSKTSSISFLPLSKTMVHVKGTDTSGCSDIDTVIVSVRQLPTVYAGKDTSVCEGKSIQLSANGAQQYTWMGSSNGANYTVSPTSTSTYYVRGVDSASCSNTDTVLVTLHKNPVLNIGKDIAVCPGTTVVFTGKGAITYQWYPMSTSGNTASLVVNANTTVTAVGTSMQGCIDSAKRMVTLLTTNRVDAGLGDTICHGESTTLTASGANSYVWPQYNLSSQQITISPTQTTYVRVEGNSSSCTTIDSVLVVVNPLPQLTISGDSTLCLTESTNLTVSGAKTYQWSNGLGSSDVVTVSPPFTSNYSVTGIDVNGCKSTQSRTVVVNHLPPTKASNNQVVCENTLVLISASGALTYNWSDGLGSGSSHSFSAKSSETYTVEGTDGNGCTNADSVTITVNPLPNVVASPDVEICKGASTELSASGANTYEWADNLGSGPIQKVTPSESTIYVVLGTDGNGCSNADSVRVTVNELPVVTLAGGRGPYCSDDSDRYTLNGSPAGGQFVGPGITGQFFIPSDAGIGINTITYLYTDAKSCAGSDTLEIEVEKCPNSVGEILESSFELYPNPNDGTFQVNNKLGAGPFKLNVYNGLGQLVENVQLNGSESQMVNLKVSSGVYLVELVNNDGHRAFQRLVIR